MAEDRPDELVNHNSLGFHIEVARVEDKIFNALDKLFGSFDIRLRPVVTPTQQAVPVTPEEEE